jgi:hypothetical protein
MGEEDCLIPRAEVESHVLGRPKLVLHMARASGIDLNSDGVLNDRPLFRGRDDVTGPAIRQLDARPRTAVRGARRRRRAARAQNTAKKRFWRK